MKFTYKSIALLLLILLGLQTNYLMVYYMLFNLNRESLIAEVCEKKVAGCNACCYLDKMMNEEGDRAKADPVSKTVTRDNIKISEYIVSILSQGSFENDKSVQYKIFTSNIYHSGYLSSIDHPPEI